MDGDWQSVDLEQAAGDGRRADLARGRADQAMHYQGEAVQHM
jgi:hypothetical protein